MAESKVTPKDTQGQEAKDTTTVMDISRKLDNVFCKIKLVQDSLANRKENAEDCNPVFAGLIGVLAEAGNGINELQMINDEIFINSLGQKRPDND